EALLLPNQNQISGASRRTRGRRGSGRGGTGAGASPEAPRPVPQERPQRFDRQDRPSQPQSQPRRDGPPGSVEALFARQNVLFESFANQQEQTLREMQRVVGNLGRGGGGASGSGIALPKVAIFLDVPNLIYAAEQVGARVHFGKLLNYLTDGRQLVRATAYAPVTDDPMTRYEAQRFVQPVLNNGYKIVTKPWKRFADGSMKANFDIELAVDILTMSDRLDIVVLLSGDGDFRRVCELVESKGVRVEVVAFAASTAMELRSVADQYTDLGQIMHLVGA
ncbi:MAG TPA: NYN domain-containing protein, partial [Dehalococcoidia bacterium]